MVWDSMGLGGLAKRKVNDGIGFVYVYVSDQSRQLSFFFSLILRFAKKDVIL